MFKPMKYSIIAAYQLIDGGIGYNGNLPWPPLKNDMNHFKSITMSTLDSSKMNAVIMGRLTWESLPRKPLANRLNIVISKTVTHIPGAFVFPSLSSALAFLSNESALLENTYVIGGQRLFEEAIHDPNCNKVYLTEIDCLGIEFQCDTFFPVRSLLHFLETESSDFVTENNILYRYRVLER